MMHNETCTGCKVTPCNCHETLSQAEFNRTGLQQAGEPKRTSDKQDELKSISNGIKRMVELFEMRCEDHAEVIRYAARAAKYPSVDNLKALEAVIATQQAKWRGMKNEDEAYALEGGNGRQLGVNGSW